MKYDVRITNLKTDGNIRAFASVNLNDEFAIKGLKVIEGSKGTFVAMPTYKNGNDYHDICFPITQEARQGLNDAVLGEYQKEIEKLHTQTNDTPSHTHEMSGM